MARREFDQPAGLSALPLPAVLLSPARLIMLFFLLEALAFGTWLPQIPQIQARLGLGPADLALGLLGMPAGLILAMPFAGPIVSRVGGRTTLLYSLPAFLCAISLPALSTDVVFLFGALVLCGVAMAMVELGMNVVADDIERSDDVAIMSRCHGFWSLGMSAGSLIGVTLASVGFTPQWSVFLVAAASLPLCYLVARALPAMPAPEPAAHAGKSTALFIPGALLLAICIVDWAATCSRAPRQIGPRST